MHVHAVNTLEIRFIEESRSTFEQELQAHVTLCEQASGCLGYALTRSPSEHGVWILSGHWASDEALTNHYRDPSLEALLGFLIDARASLSFSLFQPTLPEGASDGT